MPTPSPTPPTLPLAPDALAKMPLLDLMAYARLALSFAGRPGFTCGILNIKSGACPEDCVFCAQSARHGADAATYPLATPDEILRHIDTKLQQPLSYLGLVASGPALNDREFEQLCRTARMVHERFDIRLCASVGFLSPERARALKGAGFTSCHHNLESAREFFPQVCTTHGYDERVETIRTARAAGLRVCSGGLFGLGENFAQRCELAAELAALGVDSIPVNFLMPIAGTPMEGRPLLTPQEALRTIAMLRLHNPDKDLVLCGGRLDTLQSCKNMVFSAGANGVMLGDYLTRPGGALDDDLRDLAVLGVC